MMALRHATVGAGAWGPSPLSPPPQKGEGDPRFDASVFVALPLLQGEGTGVGVHSHQINGGLH